MTKKKDLEVIDRGGAKTVQKSTAFITRVKQIFLGISILWIGFIAIAPIYVKNNYSSSIKKTMVVSVFFDLQRNIADQYKKLLSGIKNSINLEKPISVAIEKVKIVDSNVKKADKVTAEAKKVSKDIKMVSNIAGRFGINTGSVDGVVKNADTSIKKAEDTTKLVNEKLKTVEKELVRVSQAEIDKMIDNTIKNQLDKNSGGLGTTFLTDYGIKHVYPWKPSSWKVGVKIYNDLEKSNVGVITILTNTVNRYFNYVAWGLVVIFWGIGFIIWLSVFKKVKAIIAPFIVCPRCGHAFADKRTAYGLLKVLKPWTWF